MTRVFADPRVVAAMAVASGIAAMLPLPLLLRIPLTVPLALVLPGLALSFVFLPDSDGWLGRLTVSVATTVALAATWGLLLTATPIGLTVKTWVPLLVGATVLGAAIAWHRSPIEAGPFRGIRFRISGRPAAALLATGALVVFAVALARTPLSAGHINGYSALWILPSKDNADSIKVGVINSESRDTSYRVVIRAGGHVVFERPLNLSAGESWTGVIDVGSIPKAQRSFDAQLVKGTDTNVPYREATLVLPGATAPPTTDVWLIRGPAGSNTMQVLVTSAEARRERFRLELRAGDRIYLVLGPRLKPGEKWMRSIDFASVQPDNRFFEARLFRTGAGADAEPYRSAKLAEIPD